MSPDKSKAPIDKSIDQDIAECERQFGETTNGPGGAPGAIFVAVADFPLLTVSRVR